MLKNNSSAEVYLIRHAETVMNTNPHLVGGRSNETLLTVKGIQQAKRLGRALLARQIIPDQVFVSPAVRTIDTARYSLAEMGLDIEPSVQDQIQELSQGAWEGHPRTEVYSDDVMQNLLRHGKDFKLDGGESMNDVALRMLGWMTKTFSVSAPTETVQRSFVYTHGGAIKYLASHLLGWTHLQTYEAEIDNASVSLLAGHGGSWQITYLNRDAEAL